MLRTRLAAGAVALAAAASVALGTAPASAADYPVVPIRQGDLQYGATYVTGTVTFYNQSVKVDGLAHFVGCRTVYATAIDIRENGDERVLDIGSTSPQCDKDHPVSIGLDAKTAGGADVVKLELRDGKGKSFTPSVYFYYAWV